MQFIEQEFPALRPRFERLYEKKYPPEAYRPDLTSTVRLLQQRYGLGRRSSAGAALDEDAAPSEATTPAQPAFRWDCSGDVVEGQRGSGR